MTQYVTKSGDTWDMIAYSQMGDVKYVDDLMTANIQYIKTLIFSEGITLTIPLVNSEVSESIPPWRKAAG